MAAGRKDVRHRARQCALQILYQWEILQGDVSRVAQSFFALQWPDVEPPSEELKHFAENLARETVAGLDVIDPMIAETAERWRPERMPMLDRLILRMAICEMLRGPEPPPAVVINEALELARTFSSEEAVRFVNGMLDAVRKKILDARA